MTKVMGQPRRFNYGRTKATQLGDDFSVLRHVQAFRNTPTDLCNFEDVREAIVECVPTCR